MKNQTTRTAAAAPDVLALLQNTLAEARRALNHTPRTAVGMAEPHAFIRKAPIAGATITTAALMPQGAGIGRDGRLTLAAMMGEASAAQITVADAVALSSRTMRAGAHLVTEAEARPIKTGTDLVALQAVPSGLRIVRPAKFTKMDDSAGDPAVTPAALADLVAEAKIDRPDDLARYSFQVPIKRADLRDVEENRLLLEVLAALVLGLGQAADAELLGAIHATTPAAFNVPAVAAKGVRWPELRAIIGAVQSPVNPDAMVAERGELFLAGVPADLSDAVTQSTVAAFDRFGVVMGTDLQILIERKGATGDVVLTAHAGLKAVLPDAGFAWAVA